MDEEAFNDLANIPAEPPVMRNICSVCKYEVHFLIKTITSFI